MSIYTELAKVKLHNNEKGVANIVIRIVGTSHNEGDNNKLYEL